MCKAFFDTIQATIDAERERYAAKGYAFTERDAAHHTIGDFIGAVFRITTPENARRFYCGYLEWLRALPAEDRSPQYTPEQVAKANIGWCFGEGMDGDRIAMWNTVTGASHPVCGTTMPTPQEAFRAGLERGRA